MTPVELDRIEDVVIAVLRADVDIANTELISATILDAVPNDATGLIIDLCAVRYLDSAGVRMLFGIVRHLADCRQGTAIVLDDDSPIRKLLKISNLDEVAYVCAARDDCVAGLRDGLTGGL